MPLPKHDVTGLYAFLDLVDEARKRGYGDRSVEIARGVYERRHGARCPFGEKETAA